MRRISLLCIGDSDLACTGSSSSAAGFDVETVHCHTLPPSQGLATASGEWIGFVRPGDAIDQRLAASLEPVMQSAACDIVYTDEDVGAGEQRSDPWFKPAWSPDRYRCQPYLGRLTLLRRELVDAVGGVRDDLDPEIAEYDLILRASERARDVVHLPMPLYHRRARSAAVPQFSPDQVADAMNVVDEHLRRTGVMARARPHAEVAGLLRLEPELTERPQVSIVIPTAATERLVDGASECLVLRCVRSIVERTTYDDYEIVCVADDIVDDDRRAELRAVGGGRLSVVDHDGPFHFAKKINLGVECSEGQVLIFLNDDTEILTESWIESMLIYALQPSVGAVGARLLFEDGRIQHAGVVGVRGNPGHAYYGFPADEPGYLANAVVPGDFLAVTAACLMTRRQCFETVGGMSPRFPVNYNDLDYCLKLRHRGWRVACTPDVRLRHFESSSRVGDVAGLELENIRRRWGRLLESDPYYGSSFATGDADFEPASTLDVMSP